MKLEGEGKLLRIFIGERDHLERKPLYDIIVLKAKESGIAGATVLRGVESYGATSIIHKATILELSEDLPIIIELVDTQTKIDGFIPVVQQLIEKSGCGGLITEERAKIIRYTPGNIIRSQSDQPK